MARKDECPKCHSKNQTETITGGMTLVIKREGDYTVHEELTYEKNDKYSKWNCTDCGERLA